MSRSRASRNPRALLYGAVLSSMLLVPPLAAQGASAESMTFPRQVLEWYLAGEADRVWEVATPAFRELAENPRGMREAATEMTSVMGAETGMLGEQMFAHPEGGGMQVYVRVVRHAQVPEMFWIVIFSPSERKVQMIMPQPRQTIRTLFPQVRLP